MDHRLIEGLMEVIAPLIKTYVDDRIAKDVAPLRLKLAEYEAFTPDYIKSLIGVVPDHRADLEEIKRRLAEIVDRPVKDGIDGKDADPEAIKAAVFDVVAELLPAEVSAAVEKIEKPKDGKDADPVDPTVVANLLVDLMPVPKDGKDGIDGKSVDIQDVIQVIEAEVQSAVASIDPPKDGVDGKSVTVDELRPMLEEMVSAIPVPQNGKDADPAEVAALIIEDVAKLIPPPADGSSVTVEEVLPFLQEMVDKAVTTVPAGKDGKDGLDGKDGKDGVGLAGALLGRSGEFIVTLSDGSTKDLGVIVGKDGENGLAGADGKDGVGFDDLDATYDGERTVALKFIRGENVKEFSFKMPVVLDRGVFKETREQPYEKGDGVTFGGSFWIAQKDSPEGKPQDGSKDWRLSVKRGRNGADGVVKMIPPQGPVKA